MSLNINDQETRRLARELATLPGESMSDAVATAVRERLERLRQQRRGDLADRLLVIGKDCATYLKEPWRSGGVDDLLYGERGPPR